MSKITKRAGIPFQGSAFTSGSGYNAASLGFSLGNHWYVDSGDPDAADDTAHGSKQLTPFATIDYAVGRCTANNGDVIWVLPGHTETVTAAGGLDLDVAGITLIGLGHGSDRPTINFTTAVGADMDVDAANITMFNFLFTGGIDALTGPIDVNAADFRLLNCEYRDVTGQTVDCVILDANADRCTIDGFKFYGAAAAGGQSAIQITGADRTRITNFFIVGNLAAGCIENVTTAATDLFIRDGYLQTKNATDLAIALVATATGNIGPNIFIRLLDDAANITECITVTHTAQLYDSIFVVNGDAERGLQYNGPVSVDSA